MTLRPAERWRCLALLTVALGTNASESGALATLFPAVRAGLGITGVLADVFDDRMRGRAVGFMYGALGLFGAWIAALVGQLAGLRDGWRIGFWLFGGLSVVVGLLIQVLFHDPGVGTADAGSPRPAGKAGGRLRWVDAMSVFRVPSFDLMLVSRLLSGHLVIGTFGIFFLNNVRHFTNDVAVLVLPPFGAGACLGAIAGGFVVDRLHSWRPRTGRIVFLQSAQLAFASMACAATQVAWQGIAPYMVCWLGLGLCQGVNPGVNRPIVMSVIAPVLRDWAFVVMLVIVEPIGWAMYSLGTGWLGDRFGLQAAFFLVLIAVMILNAAAITPLYWTYARDVARLRTAAASGGAALAVSAP